jgi:hypothetical protein
MACMIIARWRPKPRVLTLLDRRFSDPYIDAMSKRLCTNSAEHWNLSQEQEVTAARLTRDAVELLTIAADRGGLEINETSTIIHLHDFLDKGARFPL